MSNYTDGIRVKISERYKPPHKINLVMTYAQRLALNKQIEDNLQNYDFLLERNVLDKMKEWRVARTTVVEDRQVRLEKAKEEWTKHVSEMENEKAANDKVVSTETEISTTSANQNFIQNYESSNCASTNNNNNNNTILMPTQAYSNILTPIPLTSNNLLNNSHPVADKSPFNISDFEDDTNSPFDNMELKSINDMAELAQVLQRDDVSYKTVPSSSTMYSTPSFQPPPPPNYQYTQQYPQYISTSLPYGPATSNYYNSETFQQPSYAFADQTSNKIVFYRQPYEEVGAKSCKSVPDIVKSLQADLKQTHLLENHVGSDLKSFSEREIQPKTKMKVDELENPFNGLSTDLQEMCNRISSMGFPIARVARTCKILGNDYKKVVEHLLALSELLDLGFSEQDISNALHQCNNDKQQALEKLIS